MEWPIKILNHLKETWPAFLCEPQTMVPSTGTAGQATRPTLISWMKMPKTSGDNNLTTKISKAQTTCIRSGTIWMNLQYLVPALTLCPWIWFTGGLTVKALNIVICTMLTVLFIREVLSEASWQETITREDPSCLREVSSSEVKSSELSGLVTIAQWILKYKARSICFSNWELLDIHLEVPTCQDFTVRQLMIFMYSITNLEVSSPSSERILMSTSQTENRGFRVKECKRQ